MQTRLVGQIGWLADRLVRNTSQSSHSRCHLLRVAPSSTAIGHPPRPLRRAAQRGSEGTPSSEGWVRPSWASARIRISIGEPVVANSWPFAETATSLSRCSAGRGPIVTTAAAQGPPRPATAGRSFREAGDLPASCPAAARRIRRLRRWTTGDGKTHPRHPAALRTGWLRRWRRWRRGCSG